MKYPVLVHKDERSAYSVSVPDIPGCFSAGDTFDEALDAIVEAIELHLEGLAEEGHKIPKAGSVGDYIESEDADNGVWGFVDVDVTPYLGNTEKINVTLPSVLIKQIDERAGNRGRSRFLAEAALKALA